MDLRPAGGVIGRISVALSLKYIFLSTNQKLAQNTNKFIYNFKTQISMALTFICCNVINLIKNNCTAFTKIWEGL